MRGRADIVFEKGDNVYVVEFKVSDGEEGVANALQQIKEKGYHRKYEGSGKKVFLVGVEYDRVKRELRWVYE